MGFLMAGDLGMSDCRWYLQFHSSPSIVSDIFYHDVLYVDIHLVCLSNRFVLEETHLAHFFLASSDNSCIVSFAEWRSGRTPGARTTPTRSAGFPLNQNVNLPFSAASDSISHQWRRLFRHCPLRPCWRNTARIPYR